MNYDECRTCGELFQETGSLTCPTCEKERDDTAADETE